MTEIDTLVLPRGDDCHLHLRDGQVLPDVVRHSAAEFARAVIMPNLKPPVTTVRAAAAYRDRILAVVPAGLSFEPLMTLYLTDVLAPSEVDRAADTGFIVGLKWYPAGATTNSESGVTDSARIDGVLERMAERGLVLQVHAEVTDPDVDVFDREAVFIERELVPVLDRHPNLKVVIEHVTTAEAVDFVMHGSPRIAATITAHHLLLNRNALFKGGLRPHHYCLPVLKRETHRAALLRAIKSGSPQFFAGTDSAPHAREAKVSACGCAGIYTAHAALPLYAEAFASVAALPNLADFLGKHGADFYGLPQHNGTLTLRRQPWRVPEVYPLGDAEVVPMRAGEYCEWQRIDC